MHVIVDISDPTKYACSYQGSVDGALKIINGGQLFCSGWGYYRQGAFLGGVMVLPILAPFGGAPPSPMGGLVEIGATFYKDPQF